MTTREIILESIQRKLSGTAEWRRDLATRYAHDRQNLRAAATLAELAQADASDVSAQTWEALVPHLDSRAMRDAVSEAARDAEFRRFPSNFDDFIKIVIEKLEAPAGA